MDPAEEKQPSGSAPRARLLAIGDVHLGTRPGSLPESLADFGLDPRELGPEAALADAVEFAIAQQVDAVLFAGDVVESSNARFEALRPLEEAVTKLCAAGIPVLAVAGNHDVEALPRLAARIEGLTLLGAGGHWQSEGVAVAGAPALHVVGWSFPERRVTRSPLLGFERDRDGDSDPSTPDAGRLPRLGLLHCDLDASGGNYAPVSRRELEAAGLDAWLLGHIHKPSLCPGDSSAAAVDRPCGYLGSLVGLDPGESGARGAWLVEVGEDGHLALQQQARAPLRWERIDVSVEGLADPEDVGERVLDAMEQRARSLAEEPASKPPRALGLRVRLVGATPHYEAIRDRIARAAKARSQKDTSDAWQSLVRGVGETVVFVDRLSEALELPIDLSELAKGGDPPALLARQLLALDAGGAAGEALLAEAKEAMRPLAEEGRWRALDERRDAPDPLGDEALSAQLRSAGTAALQALLAQQRAAAGEGSR